MKILLDESLPRKIRYDFGKDHDVWTVRDKDWLGKKNGELLKLMIDYTTKINSAFVSQAKRRKSSQCD